MTDQPKSEKQKKHAYGEGRVYARQRTPGRPPVWVCEFFFLGKRYRESTGRGGTEKDAAKLLRRRLTQIERGESCRGRTVSRWPTWARWLWTTSP
jgi:hypothetical protein